MSKDETHEKIDSVLGIPESDLEDEEDFLSEDESKVDKHTKKKFDVFNSEPQSDNDDFELEEDENEDQDNTEFNKEIAKDSSIEKAIEALNAPSKFTTKNSKLKKLSPEELEKQQLKIKKTGVVYLSKIPPYMKPSKLRSIFQKFGETDRIFLKPEDHSNHLKRVKHGGNKKKIFVEGWCEFINKKNAKLCVATLNGNKLGGKKGSFYYDDIINLKYLKNFKWSDLTEQINKENEIRESKLQIEISQANRLNKAFINNYEKSKMINSIKRKRDEKASKQADTKADTQTNAQPTQKDDIEVRRVFKQRKVASSRSDADEKYKDKPEKKLVNVWSNVF